MYFKKEIMIGAAVAALAVAPFLPNYFGISNPLSSSAHPMYAQKVDPQVQSREQRLLDLAIAAGELRKDYGANPTQSFADFSEKPSQLESRILVAEEKPEEKKPKGSPNGNPVGTALAFGLLLRGGN